MDNKNNWFDDVDNILSETLNFKVKLGIGEDAYTSLRIKNAASDIWEIAGAATTGATVANSAIVASTFFAPSGLLAMVGLSGAAITPIGWVIAAGVVTGGAWIGVIRYLKKISADRVTIVPNFINSPIDVLALGLFDLIAPLAIKIAAVDNHLDDSEHSLIREYFVKEWGYDGAFVDLGIGFIHTNLENYSIEDIATTLAKFTNENRDCNFEAMSKEITVFLHDIVLVDGRKDEREEKAIATVQSIFQYAERSTLGRAFRKRK
ncbi:TerB family tellurite resistance protein [Sedimenticola hydrogenitrophicus]|uniref:TerB family tellurite resistance protein n=1 Tax=Sedimenticola hydrogenitrophicus TaxID=2967975 RepID=UPI0021A4A014|nr:TerB family tellurite resistance protein [Sedimenticola hydrogenitrophicus]